MGPLDNLIDEPRDILALFGGTIITIALIAIIFVLPELGDLALGALITQSALIYNHFFQKPNTQREE